MNRGSSIPFANACSINSVGPVMTRFAVLMYGKLVWASADIIIFCCDHPHCQNLYKNKTLIGHMHMAEYLQSSK